MRPEENIEKLIKSLNFKASAQLHNRTLNDVLEAHEESRRTQSAKLKPNVWRITTKSKITKLAAAAVVVIAVTIGIKALSATPAWAQVVKAFNKATDIYVVKTSISTGGRIIKESESWVRNQTLFRAETEDWCVIDDGKEVLTLYKEHKIAHVRDSLGPYWDYTPLILKLFRDNESESNITVTRLPEESNDAVDVYQIDFRDYWRGKAWIDGMSNLPVRIAGFENEGVGEGREFEMEFAYEPMPDELFRIVIPPYYRELPRIIRREDSEDQAVLFGTVVDEQGSPVAGAVVCASYARYGRTDEAGKFSLTVPPSDGSNSLSPRDFPMFVWAYKEGKPDCVAWMIIRHPKTNGRLFKEDDPGFGCWCTGLKQQHILSTGADGILEQTERGVELIIQNEDELNENIAGSAGEFFGELWSDPKVQEITLVMRQGCTITGWVNDPNGEPIANATVGIEELQMQLGGNRITITNLGHDWQGASFAVTDEQGNYSLNNLPACWDMVRLKAVAPGRLADEQIFESDGNTITDACTFQLRQGIDEVEFLSPGESEGGTEPAGGMYGVVGGGG